ncbi:MAG: polysulfide reductase NrfD, partial [Methanosarcinales archaeon]|nr:polysulfide reductase NrfD [Methanosarcinales archaeon]
EHLVGINFILHGPFAFSLFGEILLASLLPFIIILHPKMRQSIPWLVAASVMIVVGVYLKRIFIVMVGMSISPLGELVRYSPTLPELMVTAGWFSLAVLLFTVTTRMLDLDPEGGH